MNWSDIAKQIAALISISIIAVSSSDAGYLYQPPNNITGPVTITGTVTAANGTLPTQAVMLGQILPSAYMSSSKVYGTGAQAIPAGVNTLVNFNTISFDDLNEFNTVSHLWTVQRAGTYIITSAIVGSSVVVTNRTLLVFVNGTLAAIPQEDNGSSTNTVMSGTTQLRLNINDTVGIYYNSGIADTLSDSPVYTYGTIERVK